MGIFSKIETRINISRNSTAFTHKVKFAFGSYSQEYTGVATSKSYNINANNNLSGYSISLSDAQNWQTASNVCIGISCACGAWFVYELVRYLQSANTVLPAKAKPLSDRKLTKIRTKEQKRLEALYTNNNKVESDIVSENKGVQQKIEVENNE